MNIKNNTKYDFLIVGAGLFGATCANLLYQKGYKVLVIDKRNHIAGNIYTENIFGINVHVYGAHIFHTSNKEVWEYVNQFATFNSFINSPLANYHGKLFNLPFNMNTFVQIWPDVKTKEDAQHHINKEIEEANIKEPNNLEEQAISMVGTSIYSTLIKEYTEKQWGKDCKDLPASIIKRIPVRFTYDNNYFNDIYQGIPIGGYTKLVERMLEGISIELNSNYLSNKEYYDSLAKAIIYTGPIDEFFNYQLGELEYRSLRFNIKILPIKSFQNHAVINYTSHDVTYTRIIEHKFFEFGEQDNTVITEEYPDNYELGKERYYPINDIKNSNLYQQYFELSKSVKNVIFGGRLGLYKYLDMDDTIEEAFKLVDNLSAK